MKHKEAFDTELLSEYSDYIEGIVVSSRGGFDSDWYAPPGIDFSSNDAELNSLESRSGQTSDDGKGSKVDFAGDRQHNTKNRSRYKSVRYFKSRTKLIRRFQNHNQIFSE
jgi:hypothetical protein